MPQQGPLQLGTVAGAGEARIFLPGGLSGLRRARNDIRTLLLHRWTQHHGDAVRGHRQGRADLRGRS